MNNFFINIVSRNFSSFCRPCFGDLFGGGDEGEGREGQTFGGHHSGGHHSSHSHHSSHPHHSSGSSSPTMMTSSSGASSGASSSSSLTGTPSATPVQIIHYKYMDSAEDFGRLRGRGRSQRRNRNQSRRKSSRNSHHRSKNYLWSRNDPDYYDYYGNYDYNGDYYNFDDDYYYDDYYYDDYYDYDYNYDYGKQSPSASTLTSPTSATPIKSMPSSPSIPSMAKDIDPGRNPYPPSGQKDGGYGNPAPTGSGTHYLPGIAHEGGNPPVGLTSGGDFHFGNGLTMSEWANDVRTHSEWFG